MLPARDELHKMKQNQECFGIMFRIGFNATPGPSAGIDVREGQKR